MRDKAAGGGAAGPEVVQDVEGYTAGVVLFGERGRELDRPVDGVGIG